MLFRYFKLFIFFISFCYWNFTKHWNWTRNLLNLYYFTWWERLFNIFIWWYYWSRLVRLRWSRLLLILFILFKCFCHCNFIKYWGWAWNVLSLWNFQRRIIHLNYFFFRLLWFRLHWFRLILIFLILFKCFCHCDFIKYWDWIRNL